MHPMRYQCWAHRCGQRLPQWADGQVVGEMIAELDDFRHATEVLSQGDDTTERRFSEVVNRGLSIVEMVCSGCLAGR